MLSCLLEEGQSSVNLSINLFFARIMSNDSNLRRPNHREKKHLRVCQWKHPFSCRVFLFLLAAFDACSPEFTGESYMSTNKPTKHVHLSLGVSRTCLILKWHVHPGRAELYMSFFYDRLCQRVKQSERHDPMFMVSFSMITFDMVTFCIDMFM